MDTVTEASLAIAMARPDKSLAALNRLERLRATYDLDGPDNVSSQRPRD